MTHFFRKKSGDLAYAIKNYYRPHICYVDFDENIFKSRLFNYTSRDGHTYTNNIPDPFTNFIKSLNPHIDTTHGFHVWKQDRIVPFGLMPSHHMLRLCDIINKSNFEKKRYTNIYPRTNLCDKYSVDISSDSKLNSQLSLANDVWINKSPTDKNNLVNALKKNIRDHVRPFVVNDRKWISHYDLDERDIYNKAVQLMVLSKHMYVFRTKGLMRANYIVEGGFSVDVDCALTEFVDNRPDPVYQIIRGEGYKNKLFPDDSVPFWIFVYLEEIMNEYGIKTSPIQKFSHQKN